MPDIFLSYNREDQATARRFAEAFEREGYKVWWDVGLRTGEAYDQVTEQALHGAAAVVVLWSKKSVDSRWVRAEATIADRNKTLFPAMIEDCRRPVMFELTQTADLSRWTGDQGDAAWRAFLADLQRFVGREPGPAVPAPKAPKAAAPAPAPSNRRSIVVLPFANMSGDPEQEYFADGISEDIITDLSKVSALSVIARNSAFTFKGKHVDLLQVAKDLKVTHILEGSVRKAGNRVRITAQLIDGATNDHIWAERYDRNLDDIFALQDEISEAIVKALKVQLFPEEKKAIEDRGTANVDAYDFYLRAQSALRQRGAGPVQRAIALYREAVTLDPRFAQAWVGLAVAYINAMIYSPETIEESRALSDEAFERAQECAPDSSMVHAAKGTQRHIVHADWLGADQAYAKAIEFAPPGSPHTANVFFLSSVGRIQEAIEGYQKFVRIDPLSTVEMVQFALDCAGRYEEAEAECRRVAALPADPAVSEYFGLLRTMVREGSQTAKTRFKRYLSLNDGYMPVHGEVLAKFDDKAAVREILLKAFEEPFYQGPSHLSGLAQMAAYFGDGEFALKCLRIAFVEKRGVTVCVIWHPLFADLRKTEGFKDLVRDLGLADYWRKSGKWGDFARPVGDDDFEVIG